MKKLALFLSILIGIAAVSCKKSYECACYDDNGNLISTQTIKARNIGAATLECSGKTNINQTCSIQ